MSLKTILMPHVTGFLFARKRVLAKRAKAEKARRLQGRAHEVFCFIQADDPVSYLLVQALPLMLSRYNVNLRFHLVSAPGPEARPEPEKASAHDRQDAQLLAARFGLEFRDPGPPPVAKVQVAERALAHAQASVQALDFLEKARFILHWLWSGHTEDPLAAEQASPSHTLANVQTGDKVRKKWGHYQSGMLYYEGEWYWGIDRLYHLEERLRGLGVVVPPARGLMFPPFNLTKACGQVKNPPGGEIDFYFSFRSPYSAIVAPRLFELSRALGAQVNLKFVLPMVMRGLPVPVEKRRYIVYDTAREADAQGIQFGRINDPVGLPTERGLSLLSWAVEQGKGQAYVESFMQGVWAEGVDAGSDLGLKRIVERAELDWSRAQLELTRETWRAQAEANREELFELGLWGVPCFRVGDQVFWGQDRLWAVFDALMA